jgi:hypothetical protein
LIVRRFIKLTSYYSNLCSSRFASIPSMHPYSPVGL